MLRLGSACCTIALRQFGWLLFASALRGSAALTIESYSTRMAVAITTPAPTTALSNNSRLDERGGCAELLVLGDIVVIYCDWKGLKLISISIWIVKYQFSVSFLHGKQAYSLTSNFKKSRYS